MEMEGVAKKMRIDDGFGTKRMKQQEEEVSASCLICAYKGLDSGSCGSCIAKAAALNRIKVAGGDSVKAAKDYAARVASGNLVVQMVPKKRITAGAAGVETAAPEEGTANKPVGIVREKTMVDAAHVKMLMDGPPRTPLRALAEDYFDDEDDPGFRENIIAGATLILAGIEQEENILTQFIKKGYAEMELEIDYGC
ncbi:unnamed protein product [Urochloa humidicola]